MQKLMGMNGIVPFADRTVCYVQYAVYCKCVEKIGVDPRGSLPVKPQGCAFLCFTNKM